MEWHSKMYGLILCFIFTYTKVTATQAAVYSDIYCSPFLPLYLIQHTTMMKESVEV